MTDEKPMFSPEFAEAMKRIEAKRFGSIVEPPKQRLLRRSFLMQAGLPETSMYALRFLGQLHVGMGTQSE